MPQSATSSLHQNPVLLSLVLCVLVWELFHPSLNSKPCGGQHLSRTKWPFLRIHRIITFFREKILGFSMESTTAHTWARWPETLVAHLACHNCGSHMGSNCSWYIASVRVSWHFTGWLGPSKVKSHQKLQEQSLQKRSHGEGCSVTCFSESVEFPCRAKPSVIEAKFLQVIPMIFYGLINTTAFMLDILGFIPKETPIKWQCYGVSVNSTGSRLNSRHPPPNVCEQVNYQAMPYCVTWWPKYASGSLHWSKVVG